MQTEDIDVSIRMLLEKRSIEFCPEARSGELAPASFRALWKQRLRWAIGWDEVSLQLTRKMRGSNAHGTRKAALAYILWARWFMQVVGLIAGIVTPIFGVIQRIDPVFCHCGLATQFLQTCMFYFYLAIAAGCTLEAIFQIHHRGWQSALQVIFVFIFMFGICLYVIFQLVLILVSLFKIATGTVGGWAVTVRSVQKSSTQAQQSSSKVESPAVADMEDVEAQRDAEPDTVIQPDAKVGIQDTASNVEDIEAHIECEPETVEV
jgi:cellulose synthase/poly-beta-1,6-N-acetylglucosamine synthase-like glycosyltransferase